MENIYNDELLPENFENIAKAYSKSLKEKGFVFVSLQEEEFNLLLDEVFVLIAKMQACLKRMKNQIDSSLLQEKLQKACMLLQEGFGKKKVQNFECVTDENSAFLSLVSLENMLILKLMLLAMKSEQLELCHKIITSIARVFAESFSCEGFVLE